MADEFSEKNPFGEYLRIYLDSSDLAAIASSGDESITMWGYLFAESKALLLISCAHVAELSEAPPSVREGVVKLLEKVPAMFLQFPQCELVYQEFRAAFLHRRGIATPQSTVPMMFLTSEVLGGWMSDPPRVVRDMQENAHARLLTRIMVADAQVSPSGLKKAREIVSTSTFDPMRDLTDEMLADFAQGFRYQEEVFDSYGKDPEDFFLLNLDPQQYDALFENMVLCMCMLGLPEPISRPSDFGKGFQSFVAAMMAWLQPHFGELQSSLCARSNLRTADEFDSQHGFATDVLVHRSRLCAEFDLKEEEYGQEVAKLTPEETPLSTILSWFDFYTQKAMKGRIPEKGDIFDRHHLEVAAVADYVTVDKRTHGILQRAHKNVDFELERFRKCLELEDLRSFLHANSFLTGTKA